jgi:hypothetical protein
MKRLLLIATIAGMLLLPGCGGGEKPGNQAVYDRIAATKDCGKLQAEFETAMRTVDRFPAGAEQRKIPLAYADAAADRQAEVGC